MVGLGRALLLLLVPAAAAAASDLAEARRLIATDDADTRKRGIDLLVQLDGEPAASALIDALRRVHEVYPQKRRAHEKTIEKFCDELWRWSKELKVMTAELKTKGPRNPEHARKIREMSESILKGLERVKDAGRRFAPYEALITYGTEALERFRSDEAAARIAEVARLESPGPLRNACIAAAGKRADGLPLALGVAGDKDPRARSFAVRALASHVSQPDALACLGARLADSHWQVRRGAAGALAAAPAASAVPLLLGARRRATGEEAATLDRHLFGHTGLHFPDVAGWEAWWAEQGDAVREGSFEKAEGKPPPHAATDLFGLPLGSQNVLFVLDLSDDARDHVADVQNKVAGAIEVLPDGARFNVVAIGEKERRFSKGPAAASARTRAEARRWLERQEASGYGIVERFLDAMRADYDGSVGAFEDLPDTIYLVAASGKVEDVALPVDSFRHWNRPVDAVVHTAALGTKAPVGLLHRLATATGGAYSGPSTDG